jgi:predicted MPP superfamily phosphohydrolase
MNTSTWFQRLFRSPMEHPDIIRQGRIPGNSLHNFLVFLYHLARIPLLLCTVIIAGLISLGALPFQPFWIAGGILLASASVDIGLLALLRWRRYSFGWIQPPWILFTFGRVVLTLFIGCLPISGTSQLIVLGSMHGGLSILACYAALIEPFWVQHTKVTLYLEGLQRPVTVLLLTDIHMERMTKRELAVLSDIDQRQPDAILLGGDLLNMSFVGDPEAIHNAREFLQRLEKPPEGIYFARGTPDVDPPGGVDKIRAGLDAQPLESTHVALGTTGIELIGLPAERSHDDLKARLRELALETQALGPRICLHHTPDLVEVASECGIDLYLAGHTHGGQICLPLIGPLATASRYGRRYVRGQHRVGPTTAYVSRGLGLEGLGAPRMRFMARPELVWLSLLPPGVNFPSPHKVRSTP